MPRSRFESFVIAALSGLWLAGTAIAGPLAIHPSTEGEKPLRLVGRHARQQLAVTAQVAPAAAVRDVTRAVGFSAEPAGVVQVDQAGMVTPLADGSATVTAKQPDGSQASVRVVVERFNDTIPIN